MDYVKFGNTGMDVSRICLGMMSFGKPGKENGVFPWAKDYEEGKAIFKKAIDLGINYDEDKVVSLDNLEKIAKAHGRTMAQESLARMLSKPYITAPIIGTTSVQQVEEAVAALDMKLAEEEIKALEASYVPHIKTGLY